MVRLYEIAKKLEDLLNGIDSETPFGYTADYDFQVATEGFHLDKISDKQTHKNFIPVFIGSLGGTYNPIPNLNEADYTIPVSIYFPVRFKNDFYALNDYLVNVFVGKMLNYGTYSGKCLSNISVAQYGELAEMDLNQFDTWVANTYNREINVKQPYMAMNFNLFLSRIGGSFLYGNEAKLSLKLSFVETYSSAIVVDSVTYNYNANKNEIIDNTYYYGFSHGTDVIYAKSINPQVGEWTYHLVSGNITTFGTITSITESTANRNYTSNNIQIADDITIQSNTEPASEQLLGQPESDGLPVNTAYSSGFSVYYKSDDNLFNALLNQWFLGFSQKMNLEITIKVGVREFVKQVFLTSVNLSIKKGEPISFAFSFAKRKAV